MGTASVYNITQIYKQSLYLYVYFIKTGLDTKKGPVMNRSMMELIYLLEARSIVRKQINLSRCS